MLAHSSGETVHHRRPIGYSPARGSALPSIRSAYRRPWPGADCRAGTSVRVACQGRADKIAITPTAI